MDNIEVFYIWLSKLKNVGIKTTRILLKEFKCPYKIYISNKEELSRIEGLRKISIESILSNRDLKEAREIYNRCAALGIKILTYEDKLYPKYAKECDESPIVLYYRGELKEVRDGVSIVGARRCSSYGKNVTREVVETLVLKDIPIISGFAKGIDSQAHTVAIKNGGYTLAFLGNSVDICYPSEQKELMKKIIDNGAILSQFPPTTKPEYYNFPKRNYLIASWCRKLLVVEASEKSGALITANFGRMLKRQIYAVPNNIYSREAIGTNKLILEEKAKIFINTSQLIDDKRVMANVQLSLFDNLTDLEKDIVNLLIERPMCFSELVSRMEKSYSEIRNLIDTMEFQGRLQSKGGIISLLRAF